MLQSHQQEKFAQMREREAPHPERTFEEQFTYGVELFNKREFFDCHDAFEELWQEERGESRLFLQALIQAAVGCYHLMNGNPTGAISQYRKCLAKLEQYPDAYLGIDAKRLATELLPCLAGAEAMNEAGAAYDVDPIFFPMLHSSV